MIDLIGAPFDLCGFRVGSRLGPAALRLAGLSAALVEVGLDVSDAGDICGPIGNADEYTEEGGLRNLQPLVKAVTALRHATTHSLLEGNLPIVLGGDHTLVVGSIAAALHHYGDTMALLWIDAHADVNTPGSSATGNVHGMPVAALAGLPSETEGLQHDEWEMLQVAMGAGPRLRLERTAWYGLRDVDQPERSRLQGLAITMHDVDRHGIETTIHSVDRWLRTIGATHVWISFDVDALDPLLAPGTGTAVRGGLTYREAHLSAELLREAFDAPDCPYGLAGLDIVETNPIVDAYNQTAVVAVEWVASLFGKTILGPR
ncbi:MAG: arginase [Fimbriimonas sp.]